MASSHEVGIALCGRSSCGLHCRENRRRFASKVGAYLYPESEGTQRRSFGCNAECDIRTSRFETNDLPRTEKHRAKAFRFRRHTSLLPTHARRMHLSQQRTFHICYRIIIQVSFLQTPLSNGVPQRWRQIDHQKDSSAGTLCNA
jgi:hypothetical protein